MSDHEKDADLRDGGSPTAHLAGAAQAEKAIADGIETAIGTPASIEEELMLEAAELLEVELLEVELPEN
ncbi:MAG: hypothetical protein OEM81_00210 [Acidimicrobiia bacterium]|nr:hypothetical protein [Acidimicrobiia bacterium]MDH3396234.1 hypothetical protein [Acidimicrobiia bacterium]MDH5615332.1 hypothetical protein [Acidimicrobiia bacterium]